MRITETRSGGAQSKAVFQSGMLSMCIVSRVSRLPLEKGRDYDSLLVLILTASSQVTLGY